MNDAHQICLKTIKLKNNKHSLDRKTGVATVKVVDRETLSQTEDFNYESEEPLNELNYSNK
jgi:hypothetical protein